jgi:hypothetical protein
VITDHWYRGSDEPCLFKDCGRPQGEHRQAAGEWMDPAHWFVPYWLRPTRCRSCGRAFGHTVHHGAPERRRLFRALRAHR